MPITRLIIKDYRERGRDLVGSSVGAFDFWKAPRIDKLMILTVSFMFASFTIFNDTNYSTISVLGAAFVLFIKP